MIGRLPVILGLVVLISCSSNPQSVMPPHEGASPIVAPSIRFSEKTPAELKQYRVVLQTSVGQIEIEFFPDIAPEHTRNFLRLVKLGFYDHTAWHRVVRGFVIQGGDLGTRIPPLQAVELASGVRRLKPEFGRLKHVEGVVSMARGDTLDSAETSFFICLAPQPALDRKYTIFGKVTRGMEIVRKISDLPLDKSRPRERVEIVKAEIIETSPVSWKENAS
jgi:peptidyl-prolyl cis-trans isomerase B (cyclophilin B)